VVVDVLPNVLQVVVLPAGTNALLRVHNSDVLGWKLELEIRQQRSTNVQCPRDPVSSI
jgi:hypothetical protein